MKKYAFLIILLSFFLFSSDVNAASIVSFVASSPNISNQAVTLTWQSSEPTDARIDVICPPDYGELSFYIKESGSYPNCEKGGVAPYINQSYNVLTIQPQGNTKTVSVDFVLTLLNNGISGETKKVTVTFAPTVTPNPVIISFIASTPNNVNGGVNLSWTTSAPTDAVIDFECPVGSIQFYIKEDNRTVDCEKGGLVSYSNQNWNIISIVPKGNTKTVSVDFELKLTKNGAFTSGVNDSKKLTINFLPQTSNIINVPNAPIAPIIVVPPTNTKGTVEDVDTQGSILSCLNLVNNLRYRSRDIYTNGEVSDLQDFLQSKGYLKSEPTGYFGLLTLQAVKDFQRDNYITPIAGFVGSITRAKIKSLSCQ